MNKQYQKYKNVIQKYSKGWKKKNPEKMNGYREKVLYGRAKKVILSRDNYQCQLCGAKENLEIHHIDGNGVGKLKEEKNNNLDNLITLCRKCHRQIDSWKIRKKEWSRKFSKCIVCGTTKREHRTKGICSKCYERTRKEYKKKWRVKNILK